VQANKTYTVVLHAADLYWSKPRQRIFSVTANGATVLKAFDVIAAAGGACSLTPSPILSRFPPSPIFLYKSMLHQRHCLFREWH
jgi:hypothetical protein